VRLSTPILISAVFLCGACLCQRANSQTNPAKKDVEATISGKVTFKGKPVPSIVVGVRLNKAEPSSQTFKATTDEEGIYYVTGLSEGNYQVAPIAPAFVITDVREHWGRSVVISASENVEAVNFDLIQGGVITGRVVDAHGHPIVEERISLVTADYPRGGFPVSSNFQTDDRGIYRIFGIRPGSYKVSVGEEGNGIQSRTGRPRSVPRTYHPDTADPAKAAVIKLGEGSEAAKIDITLGNQPEGFVVSGRIVESETGKPVPNVTISLEKITIIDANNSSGVGGPTDARSNIEGAFRLENLPSGKYSISIEPPSESDLRAERIGFDVLDQDVTGLLIKTSRGASISGTLVFENRDRNASETKPTWLSVHSRHEEGGSIHTSSQSAQIKPDGSFRIGGLVAATVSFSVGSFTSTGNAKPMTISRVERGGILQPNGVEIRNGEHISDIRIVTAYSSGSIRGVVGVQNGTLPSTAHLVVTLSKVGDANSPNGGGTATDSRGHFLIEGLAAGTYEVRVTAYVPEWRGRRLTSKQLVSVNDGTATDVMLTIDLTPGPKQ
jgi:uncharacterized GH25 family protein